MSNSMLSNSNIFTLRNGKTVYDVAVNIKYYLEGKENMNTQVLKLENGSYVVQGRSYGGKLKQFAGMDKVLSVKLTPIGVDNMTVEIGKGKWLDKVAGGALAWFVAWPFLLTTAYGAYKQGTLPRKIISNIETYLAS